MSTYTIKQLSDQFQISASALRYYEEIGLLCNVEHTDKHQRIYRQEHLDRLNAIQCFKQSGLSIDGMLRFFKDEKNLLENIDDVVSLMTQHEEEIKEKISDLQEGLEHIQQKVWFYQEIQKAINENTTWPCWDDYKPTKAK